MVGGSGERHLLRAVAQHADWWNYPYRGRADYARKQEVLKAHCRDVGRDYDQITQVARVGILIAETEAELERLRARPDVRPLEADGMAGTPAQLVDALAGAIVQGADRLTVHFADAPRPEGTDLFTAAVLPHL
jgi:alkanesulfonate monooxygenase SsuD/methylene tetrahydromethanopterin reductase-like flavin-dependent oxidoreductase (luciferase family)